MSLLGDLLREANVTDEQIKEVVAVLKSNPLEAMAAVNALNIPQEIMQQLMGLVLTQPQEIELLAREVGLSADDLQSIQSSITGEGGEPY